MKGDCVMNYYDSIRLEIYEAYDNGEISYDEKEYLLEAVGEDPYELEDRLDKEKENKKLGRKVINAAKYVGKKVEDGVVDKINTPINNGINKAADYVGKKIKVNSPKAHKLRNRVRMGVKTLGVVGVNQAVTSLPGVNVPPVGLCYTKSLIKTLQKSKHPLDKVAVKKLEKLIEDYKNDPSVYIKYDPNTITKHHNAWNNTNEYVYDAYPEYELDI